MNRVTLVNTSLLVAFVGLVFLSEVRHQFNGADQQEKIASFWKDQVGQEQLKRLVLASQFAEFKQEVAGFIPDANELDGSDQDFHLRNLASVIPQKNVSGLQLIESPQNLLNAGKDQIKQRDFGQGIQLLNRLLQNHPDSLYTVEAQYLLVEAYHQQGNTVAVVKWTEKMVELFPENPLTGYALLKVGQVYEADGRYENAIDVYRTIVSAYKDKGLLQRAQSAVKQLGL
jgi:TolA-binding protein